MEVNQSHKFLGHFRSLSSFAAESSAMGDIKISCISVVLKPVDES